VVHDDGVQTLDNSWLLLAGLPWPNAVAEYRDHWFCKIELPAIIVSMALWFVGVKI